MVQAVAQAVAVSQVAQVVSGHCTAAAAVAPVVRHQVMAVLADRASSLLRIQLWRVAALWLETVAAVLKEGDRRGRLLPQILVVLEPPPEETRIRQGEVLQGVLEALEYLAVAQEALAVPEDKR